VITEVQKMLANLVRGFGLDGIDQVESNVTGVPFAEFLNGGRVTIGDGAISAKEEQNDNFGTSGVKRVGRPVIQIQNTVGSILRDRERSCKEKQR